MCEAASVKFASTFAFPCLLRRAATHERHECRASQRPAGRAQARPNAAAATQFSALFGVCNMVFLLHCSALHQLL